MPKNGVPCFTVFTLFLLLAVFLQPHPARGECTEGDCQNGLGVWHYPDGSYYVGEWRAGEFFGTGRFIHPAAVDPYEIEERVLGQDSGRPERGDCIEGDCEKGYGIWQFPNGSRYEGQWQDGRFNGQGALIHPNGKRLVSTYRNGEVVFGGETYDGPARPDNSTAVTMPAFMIPSAGNRTAGEIIDTLPAAKEPEFTMQQDSRMLLESFKEQKTRSIGDITTTPMPSKLSGSNWLRPGDSFSFWPSSLQDDKKSTDQKSEEETITFGRSGKCIAGNCFNGEGTWEYKNGSQYVGSWKDGLYHGQGTLIHPDGRKITRTFKNGDADW